MLHTNSSTLTSESHWMEDCLSEVPSSVLLFTAVAPVNGLYLPYGSEELVPVPLCSSCSLHL